MSDVGIDEYEPQDAPPSLVGCPYCRRTDAVQRAALAAERGLRLFDPVPRVKLGRRPVAAVVLSAAAGGSAAGMDAVLQAGQPAVPLLVPLVACAASTAAALINIMGWLGIHKRRNRIRAGQAAALAVWNGGWYCGRCGLIYFQPGYEPTGIRPGQSLTVAQFQHLVYAEGGYPDLSREALP